MRHIIPISGKDSLCTAIVQIAKEPDLNYEYIFNDIGNELPDTYKWLDNVEKQLNIEIKRIGKNLTEVIYEQGILPSQKQRFCTRLCKIYPMEDMFTDEEITIYFGLRADEENRGGYQTMRKNVFPKYPLREMNINLDGVYKILDDRGLFPPTFFWKSVYEQVEKQVEAKYIDDLPRPIFNALFAWRSRTNCYHCFNQRLYEWIGLYEHYPELYEEAVELEEDVGGEGFTWKKGYNLSKLVQRADQLKRARVKDIIKEIYQFHQMSMFDMNKYDGIIAPSCGLFCGK